MVTGQEWVSAPVSAVRATFVRCMLERHDGAGAGRWPLRSDGTHVIFVMIEASPDGSRWSGLFAATSLGGVINELARPDGTPAGEAGSAVGGGLPPGVRSVRLRVITREPLSFRAVLEAL